MRLVDANISWMCSRCSIDSGVTGGIPLYVPFELHPGGHFVSASGHLIFKTVFNLISH